MRRTRSPSRPGTIQAIAWTPAADAEPGARSDLGGIAASIQPPGPGGGGATAARGTAAPGARQRHPPAHQRPLIAAQLRAGHQVRHWVRPLLAYDLRAEEERLITDWELRN